MPARVRIGSRLAAVHDIVAWPEQLRREMFDRWSIEFDAGEPKKFRADGPNSSDTAWASFKRPYEGERATVATIIHLGQQGGWDGHRLKPLPNDFLRFLATTTTNASIASGSNGADATNEEFNAELKRLAALVPMQFERARKKAAEKLGVRVGVLERMVNALRDCDDDDARQGRALNLVEPDPWPEAVDGHTLVRDLVAAILNYVAMAREDALVDALWTITLMSSTYSCARRGSASQRRRRDAAKRPCST
jgi:hypothetical protein